MDTAQLTGQPEDVTLGGDTYPVRTLAFGEWGPLQAWIKRASPSPITRAAQAVQQAAEEGAPLDLATEGKLWDHAQMAALAWPPRIGSKPWFEVLNTVDGGQAQFLLSVLKPTVVGFDLVKAEALAPRVTGPEWAELVRVCWYGLPASAKKKDDVKTPETPASGPPSPGPKTRTSGAPKSSPR